MARLELYPHRKRSRRNNASSDSVLKRMRLESDFSLDGLASYLGISVQEYLSLENSKPSELPFAHLERLADLYHVEEYDILTGKAHSQTVADSPEREKELIPFFKLVLNYLKIQKLLDQCNDNNKQ